MNGTGRADHTSREIARGLSEVLDSALAPDAPALALSAGREVALLLDLAGLERVLAIAELHGANRPAALEHVLDRLRRLNRDVRETESVAGLQAADAELGAHAATLAAQEWTAPAPGRSSAAIATISLVDALPGWPVRGVDPAAPPIVTAPVAAALSAACDWLGLEPSRGMDAEVHDDFVALILDVHQPEGLVATGDVLGTVGGHLTPTGAGSHRWRLVVPRSVQRASFLLVEQGRLGLAVPWHSVLKLRMLSPERAAEEAGVIPPLRWATHSAGERPAALLAHGLKRAWFFADRVVWRFAADTEEAESVPPVAGLSLVVRGDENTPYWVVEPAWLLRTIPADVPDWHLPPETAAEPERTIESQPAAEPEPNAPETEVAHAHTSPEPVRVGPRALAGHAAAPAAPDAADAALDRLFLAPAPEASEPAAAEEWAGEEDDAGVDWLVTHGVGEAPAGSAAPAPTLTLLSADDVEPLTDEAPPPPSIERSRKGGEAARVPSEPATGTHAAPEAPPEPEAAEAPTPVIEAPAAIEAVAPIETPVPAESPAAPAEAPATLEITSRLALVAEDSLVASIFLQRLLEQRGFRAVSVEMALDLTHELQRGGWGLVCVDVHLPDAAGGEHLEAAVRAAREAASGVAVVALTRDADDERLALGAGVAHHLRKPFEAGAMDKLFVALGLAKPGGRA